MASCVKYRYLSEANLALSLIRSTIELPYYIRGNDLAVVFGEYVLSYWLKLRHSGTWKTLLRMTKYLIDGGATVHKPIRYTMCFPLRA